MALYGSSGYGPGNSFTVAGGGDTGALDYAKALLARESAYMTGPRPAPAAPPPVRRVVVQQVQAQPRPVSAMLASAPQNDRITPEWFESQGAATRPTGLGAQMIPGMQADESKLPPWMRHPSSSFAPTAITAASSLLPDRTPLPSYQPYDGGGALGSAADAERARMAAAYARTR